MVDLQEAKKLAMGLVGEFEGFRPNPYPDPGTGGAPWTIGYGSTHDAHGDPVTQSTPAITETEALDLAMRDMYAAFVSISSGLRVPLSSHETAAVMDFVYNVGVGNFRRSTLLRLINAGRLAEAAREFEAWDHANGKVMAGLLKRRLAEESMFDTRDS